MESIFNLFDEEALVSNMKGASCFILLFEHFADNIEQIIKDCFSNEVIYNGKRYSTIDPDFIELLKQELTDETKSNDRATTQLALANAKKQLSSYQKEITKKKYTKANGKSYSDTLRASIEWLSQFYVFSEADIEDILRIRKRRNEVVHELFGVLYAGLSETDGEMIGNLLNYNRRINKWHIGEFEIPIAGSDFPEGVTADDVYGIDDVTLNSIIRILFCNEGKQFKDAIDKAMRNETSI